MKKIAFSIKKMQFFFCTFHHIYGQFQGQFSYGKNDKNLGLADAPLVGEKSHVFPNILFEGSLCKGLMWKAKVESLKEEGTGERSIDKRHLKNSLICL